MIDIPFKPEIVVKESEWGYRSMGIKWEENGKWYGFYQEGWDYAKVAFLWWLHILGTRGNVLAKWIVNIYSNRQKHE